MVDGMNKEESLNETGIVQKIQIAMVDLNHPLVRVAKRALFDLTKGLFDLAEKFFAENAEEFQSFGRETGKEYEYDESVMQNYTIENVFYNTDYAAGDEVDAGDVAFALKGTRIKPIAMGSMDWELLFKEWT